MAALTPSNAAAFGHGGAQATVARIASGRAGVVGLALCLSVPVGDGFPSGRFTTFGAAVAVAAETDQTSAATLTALSTPTAVDVTPLQYVVSTGITFGAGRRAAPINDLRAQAQRDAEVMCESYLMGDDTAGLSELISALSASAGTSGDTLTVSTAFGAHDTLGAALNHGNHAAVLLIDGIGRKQLQQSIISGGNAAFANPTVSLAPDMVGSANRTPNQDNGHWLNLSNKLAVVVEPAYDSLDVVSGDKVGCCFLPVNDPAMFRAFGLQPSDQQTADEIMPAFGLAYFADPAFGIEDVTVGQVDRVDSSVGPLVTAPRANTGAATLGLDTRFAAAVGTINATGAVKVLYVNS